MSLVDKKSIPIQKTDEESKVKYRITPNYSAWVAEKEFIIQVALPGVSKENIKIKALKDLITLRAERGDILYSLDLTLHFDIVPNETKTNYEEGLLQMSFQLYDPLKDAYLVPIE